MTKIKQQKFKRRIFLRQNFPNLLYPKLLSHIDPPVRCLSWLGTQLGKSPDYLPWETTPRRSRWNKKVQPHDGDHWIRTAMRLSLPGYTRGQSITPEKKQSLKNMVMCNSFAKTSPVGEGCPYRQLWFAFTVTPSGYRSTSSVFK